MDKPGYKTKREDIEINALLARHRLVLSDNLLRIYDNYAKRNGIKDAFDHFTTWYSSQAYTVKHNEKFVYISDAKNASDDIDTVFVNAVKNIKKPVVVCDFQCSNCYSFSKGISPVSVKVSSSILDETVDNKLRRNILPFAVETQKDDPVEPYLEWFGEMLHAKKHVVIFNRFTYSNDEFNVMVDYIFNQIAPGAEIKLYLDHYNTGTPKDDIIQRNKRLKQLTEQKSQSLTIYSYDANKSTRSYHERIVFLDEDRIRFTGGFNCLVPLIKRKLNGGKLEISHRSCNVEYDIKDILEEHPDYLEIWDSTKDPEDFLSTPNIIG